MTYPPHTSISDTNWNIPGSYRLAGFDTKEILNSWDLNTIFLNASTIRATSISGTTTFANINGDHSVHHRYRQAQVNTRVSKSTLKYFAELQQAVEFQSNQYNNGTAKFTFRGVETPDLFWSLTHTEHGARIHR